MCTAPGSGTSWAGGATERYIQNGPYGGLAAGSAHPASLSMLVALRLRVDILEQPLFRATCLLPLSWRHPQNDPVARGLTREPEVAIRSNRDAFQVVTLGVWNGKRYRSTWSNAPKGTWRIALGAVYSEPEIAVESGRNFQRPAVCRKRGNAPIQRDPPDETIATVREPEIPIGSCCEEYRIARSGSGWKHLHHSSSRDASNLTRDCSWAWSGGLGTRVTSKDKPEIAIGTLRYAGWLETGDRTR